MVQREQAGLVAGKRGALTGNSSTGTEDGAGSARLLLRGAVLLRVVGRREPTSIEAPGPVGAPLLQAIRQGDGSPWRLLLDLARHRGRRLMAALTLGTAAASALVTLEALLFLGLIRAAGRLGGFLQLPAAIIGVALFLASLLALELALAAGARHLGRELELRVRAAFLRKIPRLGDRFFESRLRSDMAERAHSLAGLRQLPAHVAELAGSACGLLATALALSLLFPDVAALAALLALLSVAIPLGAQPALAEQAASLRAHAGGLAGTFLDGLRGLAAIRAHRAERSLQGEHQRLLGLWLRSALSFHRRAVAAESAQALVGLTLAVAMVLVHTGRHGVDGGVLLLAYWALALPELGAAFALGARQLPDFRALTARIAEPIRAPEEATEAVPGRRFGKAPAGDGRRGVAIRFDGVSVVAAGHTLLRDVEGSVGAGERIAVLGVSGAGKSTLLALLLGWHSPAGGRVLIDGAELDAEVLARLRQRTAWVDPAVTLWNRSLFANLRYGDLGEGAAIRPVCRAAQLRAVIAGLPSGLATLVGEGGGRLAGGEGQRVRFGRALTRRQADLVVLDEPFRGLERARRESLLRQAFEWWQGATLFCATHDLGLAHLFDRVAVIHGGELVELDTPEALSARPDSRFSELREGEVRRTGLWRAEGWRRLRMDAGELQAGGGSGVAAP
ncbi:MAG: ABC transporter ATP-binding protein/permease [Holophagales bacterium]|nr:ABC transporter ATP-binding protein/permease [Holophagales bacterium]